MIALLALCGAIFQDQTPQGTLDGIRGALARKDKTAIRGYFRKANDSDYLFSMAEYRGGLQNLHIAIIPSPPGWQDSGSYWATFHTFEDIEEDHDPVYPVKQTPDGWKLGAEISESECGPARIQSANIRVTVSPATHQVDAQVNLKLSVRGPGKALVYRLNDIYDVAEAKTCNDRQIPAPSEGDLVRAGGLLIPWTARPTRTASFKYTGTVNQRGQDHINTAECYLTAWWVPSLGRLPFRSRLDVVPVPGWVMRSESDDPGTLLRNGLVTFENTKMPISFPKLIGGKYALASELKDGGRTFRAWQFAPTDKKRADEECKRMAQAARFYSKQLIPFPYNRYECFDGHDYYGIESYSYTLLAPSITVRYAAHEMGHTYFGGITPCSYVHDSWNEGVTTYVDDVLTGHEVDHPLQAALTTINVKVPLTEMGPAHSFEGASYWRGAAVMKMLEHEIGLPAVLDGLRAMLKNRVGKDTRWDDLRSYFEEASSRQLGWFWNQWIDGATFPNLKVSAILEGKTANVTIRQSGTTKPYRLRIGLLLIGGKQRVEREVELTSAAKTAHVTALFKIDRVEPEIAGFALVRLAR
jgi:hypothetical protein